ncbi:MAG TPA: methyltransferase domain-containing protein [Gammaproteobacteria bacterium]|nr:methyltransferase domain-containing protein [Gammaproteobacteria bacterium]
MKASEQIRLTDMEKWFHEGQGQCLHNEESQWVDAYLKRKRPQICLQVGGAPFDCNKHVKYTHMLHLDRRMEFFCLLGHSVCADFFELPFADESFNVILCPHVHEILENSERFFDEIIRVLKPGGSLVVMGINPKSLWSFQNIMVRENLFPWMYHHWGCQKVINLLRDRVLRVEDIDYKHFKLYSDSKILNYLQFQLIDTVLSDHASQLGALYFLELTKEAYTLNVGVPSAV